MEASQWVSQFIDTCADEKDARRSLAALRYLEDCLGGRVLAPSAGKPGWRVQAFFPDMGPGAAYPDGMRRVLLTPEVQRRVGLDAARRAA